MLESLLIQRSFQLPTFRKPRLTRSPCKNRRSAGMKLIPQDIIDSFVSFSFF